MTPTATAIAAAFLALVVAARSTWSPCGLSMLSTLTPLGEAGRGHRYPVTAAWFVLGAAAGGAALGALLALGAWAVGAVDPSADVVAAVVAAAAVMTVAADARLGGVRLPAVPRQVDELWVNRFRPWVYASGFGAQIGAGLVTYVMTAGVYLMVVLAVVSGRPAVGFVIGLGFGTLRGLAILLGVGLSTPEAIRRFHARLESLAGASLAAAVVAQLGVLAVALGAVWAGVATAAVLVVAAGRVLRTHHRRRPAAAGR